MNELFQEIEGLEFTSRVGVASSCRLFLKAVLKSPEVQKLRQLAQISGPNKIAERVSLLIEEEYDSNYLSPRDTAVAAYLGILGTLDLKSAITLSKDILGDASGKWYWAAQVGGKLLPDTGNMSIQIGQPQRIHTADAITNVRLLVVPVPAHQGYRYRPSSSSTSYRPYV